MPRAQNRIRNGIQMMKNEKCNAMIQPTG